jgi:hypothetical protein
MPIPLGVLAVAGVGGEAAAYELINTQVLSSTATDIYFDPIPQTYRHLQIRMLVRNSQNFTTAIRVRPNYDSANNYYTHRLGGNGTTVASTSADNTGRLDALIVSNTATANVFGASILDLVDYTNASKFKTFKSFQGYADVAQAGTQIGLHSIQWRSTSAVTAIQLNCWDGAFAIGSRFSLYGIR